MPRYENTDGPAPGGPANELELELQLRRVILREFAFELRPLLGADPIEGPAGVFMYGEPTARGIELEATASDTGLKVLLRFERGEFVNVATTGLAMLDAADAATDI